MTIKCDKCGKQSEYDGLVWFTFKMPETHLCQECYQTWNKAHREFLDEHKKVKAMTKDWQKMCEEETKLFQDWLKKQKKAAKKPTKKATTNGKKKTKAHRNH